MAKRFYRVVGSDEILTQLPEGHTMSMGYLTETLYTESEVLAALMNAMTAASSDEQRRLIDNIGSELGIM